MRIAVLGARGMLGTDAVQVLTRRGWSVSAYDLPDWDIRSDADMRRAVQGSDAVLNCAAYTNVDKAEAEPELAGTVNREAVARLGAVASEQGTYVLHIGTDFVFDGRKTGSYSEDDEPRPLSVYGRTKLEGERALQASGCPHAIVRVQWTYGAAGYSFVHKLVERARSNPQIKMVNDQTGAPTWTGDVAAALAEFLERRTEGLFHYAARGCATRFEIARFILDELALDRELVPCRTSDFPAAAERPLNSLFDCSKIDRILARPRPLWQQSLQSFLQSLPVTTSV